MYAIYSKHLNEVYYAENKEILDAFMNDRCRSPKDFLVKEVDNRKFTERDMSLIEDKLIFEGYGTERIITKDEAEFFDQQDIGEVYKMKRNLEGLIKNLKLLVLTKEEQSFCDNVLNKYYQFLTKIIEFEHGDEEYYDWMVKFCNINVIYDIIIRNWSGRL